MSSIDLYNVLAKDYEALTGRTVSPGKLRSQMEALVRRYGWRRVVDAACGTGHHALALANLGIEVVGIDLSEEMIRRARVAAREAGVDVRFEIGDMRFLDQHVGSGWDAVLCLGNSIAHLRDEEDLTAALLAFGRCLLPGGVAIVQILNYPLLVRKGERVVAITRSDHSEFVRFNDYLDDGRVRFNVLTIRWHGEKASHTMVSTDLRAFSPDQLATAFARASFDVVENWSDLLGTRFEPDKDRSVVFVAKKRV